jgi:hypothetical protein
VAFQRILYVNYDPIKNLSSLIAGSIKKHEILHLLVKIKNSNEASLNHIRYGYQNIP